MKEESLIWMETLSNANFIFILIMNHAISFAYMSKHHTLLLIFALNLLLRKDKSSFINSGFPLFIISLFCYLFMILWVLQIYFWKLAVSFFKCFSWHINLLHALLLLSIFVEFSHLFYLRNLASMSSFIVLILA